MKILVCIKQVPDAKDIQWTENNTMKREGVESVINPCDLYALETALDIKKKFDDAQIYAISMGPNQAEKALKETIALGCDEAYLLCDKKFSGSDTLATGLTLSAGIKKIMPDFDLILCGQYASDGDTAQTGVGIAQNLNCNQITYVLEITEITDNYVVAKKDNQNNFEYIKSPLPAVLCVMENKTKELSIATILGQMRAQDSKIKVLTIEDIGLSDEQCGIKGSPTYVSKVFRPIHTRKCEVIDNDKAVDFSQNLVNEVRN